MLSFKTFEERLRYLLLDGVIGKETFGFDRHLNQVFYKSSLWRSTRRKIIIRDNGCDLAIPDMPISLDRIFETSYKRCGRKSSIYVHHMNPLMKEDLMSSSEYLLNPEYLISVSYDTHAAIHYGNVDLSARIFVERTPNDTTPWRIR